jgi:hypothetical protein
MQMSPTAAGKPPIITIDLQAALVRLHVVNGVPEFASANMHVGYSAQNPYHCFLFN